jgi:hypothetical protein
LKTLSLRSRLRDREEPRAAKDEMRHGGRAVECAQRHIDEAVPE